ncbi:polyphosphate kinase 1 [Longimicrobium sp.]|uniref:polyphosphate kinase 1 n=1 Tax=Longimicrobium sp. TaxID=2029185 RepID=UPI003B3A97BF
MRAQETPVTVDDLAAEPAPSRPPLQAVPAITPQQPTAVKPQPVPPDADLDHPSLYFNRELGLLDFNWRVLHQARDGRVPLLERVRFLAITSSNLDEFFQKRVGGLKRQLDANVQALSQDGRSPGEQLAFIAEAAQEMYAAITHAWDRELRPLLRTEADVVIADWTELDGAQQKELNQYFRENIYPILTPLAVDPGHPFPFISNLSLSLAVLMRHGARNTMHFARLKVPTTLGRWLAVPHSPHRHHVLPVEQLIQANVAELFPGMEIVSASAFRVTRNADVDRDDDDAEDLVEMISEELRERRFAPVVRLEVERGMPGEVRDLLCRELELDTTDVYDAADLVDHADCIAFADLDLPAFKYDPWEPVTPEALQHEGETEDERNLFAILRNGDLLVHHPYESFTASVQRLLNEAADDPAVLAIKMTLYRTGVQSPVVQALLRAAERGKQVAVLVEVTARFDEANNIVGAQMLEDAGVHVTYGLVGYKTHSKVTLVVRMEEGRPRTYCHIGTGNYHAKTTRLYTDLGLLTANREIGADLVNFFHFLTGYAPDQHYQRLIVAPRDMRRVMEERIHREVQAQRAGGRGRIVAKMNALDDTGIIQELYRASQAGVQVDLIIRGHSRLRPGLPGYSDNIRVISILGRFLEHDRVYYFHNGGDPEIFISSADWRGRNLNERVETMAPVLDAALRERIVEILHYALNDNRLAWDLRSDGRYVQRRPAPGEPEVNYQEMLMRDAHTRSHAPSARPWELTV